MAPLIQEPVRSTPQPNAIIPATPPHNALVPAFTTEVAARIDVGFGNQLYIRGQGGGLTWEKGTPLKCKDASTWVWSSRQTQETLRFKLLLNDQIWAQGQDLVVQPGTRLETIPQF